ncbi:MAG: ABC transporter substrate-binding protein, partial [Proteobacteria bacterium]|nr:ABC transporter substrate-binding protein [Pseudomonadota bacterium]
KIGILGSLSGPYATWGQHYQQAVDLFVEQRQGQIGPHKISIIYRDVGGNNPDRAKQLAQELIVRDGVRYLAGLEFTPAVLAVGSVVDQAKMPFVIFNSGTSVVTRKSPFYVRTGFTQWSVAIPLAHWAYDNGKHKCVIVSADYAPGYDAIDSFQHGFKQKNGTISEVIKVPMGTADFSSYLQRIQDAKPDCTFMFMPVGPMSVGFIKSYTDRGLRRAGIDLFAAAETEETDLPAIGDGAVGMVSALHYSPYLDNPANKAFVAALKAKYGEAALPNVASVAAYDGMTVVAHMIETVGAAGGEKAIDSVKGFAWVSPRGPVSIDAKTRDIVQNIYIRKVEKIDGKLVDKDFFTFRDVKDPWKELNPE